jgi:hypothetical protein
MDRAGWHIAARLIWPANITPLRLPPYSPQLKPIERVWLHLRERHLTHRLFDSYDAIQACCEAWNALLADIGRMAQNRRRGLAGQCSWNQYHPKCPLRTSRKS